MPVSNPPFGYYSVSNKTLEIYSRGAQSGNVGNGKNFYLYAAAGFDAGTDSYGGNISVYGGYGQNTSARPSHGGYAKLAAGNGGDTINDGYNSTGGYVYIYAGNGGHTTGNGSASYGGKITMKAGNANSDTYYSSATGVNVAGGDASGAYSNTGGNLDFAAGQANNGSNYNHGGRIYLHGGVIAGTQTTDFGGDVFLRSGAATTHGKSGNIKLQVSVGADANGNLIISGIPTVAPLVSGAVWNSAGILHIVP